MTVFILVMILISVPAYLLWEGRNLRRVDAGRPRWRRWLRALIAVVIGFALLKHAFILYSVIRIEHNNPSTTALMDQRARESGAPRREWTWVNYEQISPNLVRAVVAGEDPRFATHSGIDWREVQRAIDVSMVERRVVRGASTISQQLVKNLYLSTSRNPVRKFHEMIIALELERTLSKRRIMELYLNVAEWGDEIYGIEAAAHHYFNTTASSLTMDQAAFLTAILPAPRAKYDLNDLPIRTRDQIQVVLENMRNVQLPAELA